MSRVPVTAFWSCILSGADRGTQLVQHSLLPFADLHRTEAHEPALLGGVGSGLRSRKEPLLECRCFLGGRLGGHDLTHCSQLVQDLLSCLRLESTDWTLSLLRHRLNIQSNLGEQLLTAG